MTRCLFILKFQFDSKSPEVAETEAYADREEPVLLSNTDSSSQGTSQMDAKSNASCPVP